MPEWFEPHPLRFRIPAPIALGWRAKQSGRQVSGLGAMAAEAPSAAELIHALRDAGEDRVRIIAGLWTWLDQHLTTLGSLREKIPAIRRAALGDPPFDRVGDDLYRELVEDAVPVAARLLARICRDLGPVRAPIAERSVGYDGAEVIVAWRSSELVGALSDNEFPPSAVEHPSLTTLAPTLLVSPVSLDGIELEITRPRGAAWGLVSAVLAASFSGEGEPSDFAIHLDALGAHGMSGWVSDEAAGVGHFDVAEIDVADEQRCAEAAREAVREAAGPASILVLPELAATEAVATAIAEQLCDLADAPLLTVVGLYHAKVEEEEEGGRDARLSPYVNEAVVYGPDGVELWRHRKLCCAEGEMVEGGPSLCEDIRLGTRLTVVPTPIGNIAVLICLDAFADHARARIAASPADLLLVPSLSPTVHRHRNSLQHLVQLLFGTAFVCNRSPRRDLEATVWNAESNRSFWAIQRRPLTDPVHREDDHHPSFVFRPGDFLDSEASG
jgi:predicted amidohydrolase